MSSLTLTHDLAQPWTERRHAAEALIREVLGSQYPLVPRPSDPLRQRVERALARRSDGPFTMDPQAAANLLEEHFLGYFRGVDEWLVEWRVCNGVRGLRILYAAGPGWLPVRAWADTYAAVSFQGLYFAPDIPSSYILADYIYVGQPSESASSTEEPWVDWDYSQGPDYDQWREHLGNPTDAPHGYATSIRVGRP